MIQVVEREEQQRELLNLCRESAFGCKIASIALAYGFDKKFSCFWKEQDSSCVYCLVDDVMIISGTPQKAEETKVFLHMVGAKEIMCSAQEAELLSLLPTYQGNLMQKKTEALGFPSSVEEEINIREIYFLLEECGMETDFEAFYLDLSHRIRHRAAFVLTEKRENELAGCVVVSSITENAAVISAVAVKEEYRRQGIANRLMEKAEKILGGKTLYLFKEEEKNEAFYEQLGFDRADKWVQASLNGI